PPTPCSRPGASRTAMPVRATAAPSPNASIRCCARAAACQPSWAGARMDAPSSSAPCRCWTARRWKRSKVSTTAKAMARAPCPSTSAAASWRARTRSIWPRSPCRTS
ncbi:hypothetical protein LTR94_035986, partial [Friedmanniomyces endolithicus]